MDFISLVTDWINSKLGFDFLGLVGLVYLFLAALIAMLKSLQAVLNAIPGEQGETVVGKVISALEVAEAWVKKVIPVKG